MPLTQADLTAALPDVTTTMSLGALTAPVTIVRDAWGVPHIRAENSRDAFVAQGFATAQDRLWHMDYDRFRALGRWSELAGDAGLTEDRMMRTFDLTRASKADYDVCSNDARSMLDAYADGINAFIDTTSALPVEYGLTGATPERWEAWHCIAVYKVRNMLMGTYEMKLWRARLALRLGAEAAAPLFRGYPDEALVSVPPGETLGHLDVAGLDALADAVAEVNWLGETDGGSNAWVVSGELTESGMPIVAGDSHRALDTPSVYYQTHLTCPEFRCSGYALPGVPGMPHFSHTEYVGWGMTHGFGDYQDLYIERFRSGNGVLEYETETGWERADVSEETLQVRNGEAVALQVVHTRHGPIVAGDPAAGHGIAFSHTGTRSGTPWPNTVLELLRARSADEAEAALREWTEPVNNFVYADIHGEFGYRYRGRIPTRDSANAWTPVPGWNGAHEWDGQIPFEELPQSRNPDTGWVVTCNNPPTTADYPHYINTYFAPDTRARRITARMQNIVPGTATVEDMASIHGDRESIPGAALAGRVAALALTDPDAQLGATLLRDWDGRMDRSSVAATVYAAARTQIYVRVIQHALGDMAREGLSAASGIGRGAATHLGQLGARAMTAMAADDPAVLPPGVTWPDAIEAALAGGVRMLRERLGDETSAWIWGSVHMTRPRHPLSRVFGESAALLDPPGIATHGDPDTPLAGGYAMSAPFTSILMSVNRYIHDPSDWTKSRWIVPLGASGHPGSPHYADQRERWADVETIAQLWDWSDIEAAAESTQQLAPGA